MLLDVLAMGSGVENRRVQSLIYTGDGAARVLPTGINMGQAGGLVWAKWRRASDDHAFFDTVRGISLRSRFPTPGQDTLSAFSVGDRVLNILGADYNQPGEPYVAWLLRKTPGVFTIVEIPAGSGPQVPHDLGVTPGAVCYLRRSGAGHTHGLLRHIHDPSHAPGDALGTSTHLTLVPSGTPDYPWRVDTTGTTWVAYVFGNEVGRGVWCTTYVGDGQTVQQRTFPLAPTWLMVYRDSPSYPAVRTLDRAFLMDDVRNPAYMPGNGGAENEGLTAGSAVAIAGGQVSVSGDFNVLNETYYVVAMR